MLSCVAVIELALVLSPEALAVVHHYVVQCVIQLDLVQFLCADCNTLHIFVISFEITR